MIRSRKIGPFLATALVASNMVGSGIFLLPATLASTGSITILGWLIATAGALLVAVTLARLGRISPQAGGPCAYAADALGPYMGFQTTAIYWISCWSGNIAIAVTASGYLASFVPALAHPLAGAAATSALIWLLTLLNILGPRLVCQFESGAILLGLIPILLVATAGWWYFDPELFRASWNVRHEPVMTAVPNSLVLVFWAFTGLESASVAAGVVENPQRNVPLATIGGVVVAALVYVTSCSVIMGLIPAADLARSSAPFADAVKLVLGPVAGTLVAMMALVKTIGTLGGWVLLTAQTAKAGADRGLFPAFFGRADRYGIPVPSLLLMAAVMSGVVFATVSPTVGEQFGKLIEVSTIFCLMAYIYSCIAIWKLDKPGPYSSTGGEAAGHRPSPAPRERGGPSADADGGVREDRPLAVPPFSGSPWVYIRYRALAVAALLVCVWVIVESDHSLLLLSAATVALTVPFYWLFIRRLRPIPV